MFKQIKSVRHRLTFDASWYLKVYPDVRKAIEDGLFKNAFDHYSQFGLAEGRLAAEPDFDEEWYLRVYGDVCDALNRREFNSAFEHFIQVGCQEGRKPGPVCKHFTTLAPVLQATDNGAVPSTPRAAAPERSTK